MKVIPNFTTRELLIDSKIKGVMSENLVNTVSFEISPAFYGYQVIVVFADDDKKSIGARELVPSHQYSTVIYDYILPNGITQYRNVYYQVMAINTSVNKVWKSAIETLYFEETLDRVDSVIGSFPDYPDWVDAINLAQTLADGTLVTAFSLYEDYIVGKTYSKFNRVYFYGNSYEYINEIPSTNPPINKESNEWWQLTSSSAYVTSVSVTNVLNPNENPSASMGLDQQNVNIELSLPRAQRINSIGLTNLALPTDVPSVVTSLNAQSDLDIELKIPPNANVSVGTTSNTQYSIDNAIVENVGINGNVVLDFTIPRAASVSTGIITTGLAGTNALVSNSGANGDVILNFTIPRGDKGETGENFTVRGVYSTLLDLQSSIYHPGVEGDAWAIGTATIKDIYIWNIATSTWINIGQIVSSTSAENVSVQDTSQYFTGTNVEAVLKEIQDDVDLKATISQLSNLDLNGLSDVIISGATAGDHIVRNQGNTGWQNVPESNLPHVKSNKIHNNYGLATGINNYIVTLSPAPASYEVGMVVNFKASDANTGASTLNCNGLGIKPIYKNVVEEIELNSIKNGQIITVIYDGTNFQIVSGSGSGSVNGSGDIPIDFTQTIVGTNTIFQFSSTLYSSAEVLLQIKQETNFEIVKLLLITDGTDTYLTEYGRTGKSTNVNISTSTSTGVVSILITSSINIATIKGSITLLKI